MDLVNGTADPDATRTVIHEVLESDLPPAEKTYERVLDDVRTVTGAAFETTANSIRMTLYQIYTNPPVLRRLRAELAFCAEGKLDEDGYFGLTELEQLPYLTGVLMEGLRFSPAIATRATRVAPDRDLVFGKWTIPAGTPIGMTSYLIHRDPTIYPEPDLFNPDRWLHAEDRWRAEKAFAPFSRGPRNCVGM
jgi:cytochrome P450